CRNPAARKDKAMSPKARMRRANEGILAHTAWSHHQKQRPAGCHAIAPYVRMPISPQNRTTVEFGQGDLMARRLANTYPSNYTCMQPPCLMRAVLPSRQVVHGGTVAMAGKFSIFHATQRPVAAASLPRTGPRKS